MKFLTAKTYWADRLFINTDYVTYLRNQLKQKIQHYLERTVFVWYIHPFFSFSLLVKNVTESLAIVGLEKRTYSFWKGFLLTLGVINGIIMYSLTTRDILSPLLLIIPIFAFIGFILPELYVLDKVQQVEIEIHNDFPRFLDLLYIYTSTAAFDHIGNAMYAISLHMEGVLSHQLRDITRIYRFVDVSSFLDRFEVRFKTPLAKDLVSTLRLADIYGGSISKKIGILAEEAHKERMQSAKQKGQKASAMLLIPLMMFHFPVAIVIFLAPTALALKQVFGW